MIYALFLNGSYYGSGELSYIQELINDYFNMNLYGKDEVEMVIKKKVLV